MHPVKPQHSTQIEYIYYFMSHRSLQFKCGNPKISVSVHLQDKSTETQQSIRRSFFCLFVFSVAVTKTNVLTSPHCSMQSTPMDQEAELHTSMYTHPQRSM